MQDQTKPEVVLFPGITELAHDAARRFETIAREAIASQGRFTVALSGGNTPRSIHNSLAAEAATSQVDWSKVYIFFGDDRCVPPTSPESNYGMAWDTLPSKVPIPPENVYRMLGEDNPEQAAEIYSTQLKTFFGLAQAGGPSPENFPRFDLIFLGMGPDGHTASLFPGTAALQERSKPVTANFVPKLNVNRLTLTAPSINRAANIVFLVAGADKAPALHQVLEGEYQPQIYPSQLIRPSQGKLVFLVDQAAAAELKK